MAFLFKSCTSSILQLPDFQLFWLSLLVYLENEILSSSKEVSTCAISNTFELLSSFASKNNFPQNSWVQTWLMVEKVVFRLCDTEHLEPDHSSSAVTNDPIQAAVNSQEEKLIELVKRLEKFFTTHRGLFLSSDVVQILRILQPIALFPSTSEDRLITRTGKKTLPPLYKHLFGVYGAIPPLKEEYAAYFFFHLLSLIAVATKFQYKKFYSIYKVACSPE